MIGHYLLTLTEVEEDRVLLNTFGPIRPRPAGQDSPCLCLLIGRPYESSRGVLESELYGDRNRTTHHGRHCRSRMPGHVYEDVCRRFGAPRVNAAIRARILENRLWRALSGSGVPTPQEQPQ